MGLKPEICHVLSRWLTATLFTIRTDTRYAAHHLNVKDSMNFEWSHFKILGALKLVFSRQ